jgi:hypothetical protein
VLYGVDGRLVCAGTRVSSTEILTAYHCAVAAVLSREQLSVVRALDPRLLRVRIEDLAGTRVGYRDFQQIEGAVDAESDSLSPERDAAVLAWAPDNDLALLRTADTNETSSRVGGDLAVGQEVFAVGHPLGLAYAVTHGYVSEPCRFDSDTTCLTEVDITTAGGSSGGGLFNARGELVGVCSAGYDGTALAYFARPEDVRSFLRTARR